MRTQFQPKIKTDKWNEVYLFHSVLKMNESRVTASAYLANKTVTKEYIQDNSTLYSSTICKTKDILLRGKGIGGKTIRKSKAMIKPKFRAVITFGGYWSRNQRGAHKGQGT